MRTPNEANRDKFIFAAIGELGQHGISDFSMRRVSLACGVSNAAPYKHFKGKNDLILEVYRYVNREWMSVAEKIYFTDAPLRQKIRDISVAYVRFLCSNPAYQQLMSFSDSFMTPEQAAEKGKISKYSAELVRQYCVCMEMPDEIAERKIYVVRSLIFGAVLLCRNGSMTPDETTYAMVGAHIDREFDLP